jgi:SAM-dependent methyltransferase
VDPKLYDTIYETEDTHWWYVARRAIVFDELRRVLDGGAFRPRILDLGCGTGRNLVELQTIGEPVGLDLERRALCFSLERGTRSLVQSAAEALPFRAESFDVVMALDLLEHLDDDIGGAREVARVLRPGGHFVVFVPAYQWLWGPQDDVSHHRRRYTPHSIRQVLRAGGFRLRRLTHANLLLLPLILAGRQYLRIARRRVETENRLHPSWSNGMLASIFLAERHLLRWADLPLGVSLLGVATKNGTGHSSSLPPEPG